MAAAASSSSAAAVAAAPLPGSRARFNPGLGWAAAEEVGALSSIVAFAVCGVEVPRLQRVCPSPQEIRRSLPLASKVSLASALPACEEEPSEVCAAT
jgi:hypothetical protein